jgi:stearoyl-CoA desaturase (delta-9 desaturase)
MQYTIATMPNRGTSPEGVLYSKPLSRKQKRVALVTVFLPAAIFVFAIYIAIVDRVPPFFFFLWIGMHVIGTLGVSLGYHRLGSHNSFKTTSLIKQLLMICGSFSAQGPILYWVTNHRRHHHLTDKKGDVHSPLIAQDGEEFESKIEGFWQAHAGWMFRSNPSNPVKYSKDMLKDKKALFVNRYYYAWIILGIILPGLFSLIFFPTLKGFLFGVLYGGFARLFTVQHVTWIVNSFTHMHGKKDFDSGDSSRNSFWVSILSMGEGWHNNHHTFPYSARLGLKWWQVDFGYYLLCLLKYFGWVSNMKSPSSEEQKLKLNTNKLSND